MKYIVVILLSLFPIFSYAQSTQQDSTITRYRQVYWENLPNPTGWTNDFEGLFTETQISVLDSMITRFKRQTNIEIAIVTIDTAFVAKPNFDALTLHYANVWGIGQETENLGILIGISKGYRKMRIQNGVGIETRLTDELTRAIIDDCFIPEFKQGKYFEGTRGGLDKIIDILK